MKTVFTDTSSPYLTYSINTLLRASIFELEKSDKVEKIVHCAFDAFLVAKGKETNGATQKLLFHNL